MEPTGKSAPSGRFYELQREVAAVRRGPYMLTDEIVIAPLTRRQALALSEEPDEERQLAIALGESYAAVVELFDERPLDEWTAFQQDLYAFFFGEGARELPGGSGGS